MHRNPRMPDRCRVCGCDELCTDEVVAAGVVLLAECPRCEHRWTATLAPEPPRALRRRAPLELEEAHAA